MQSKHGLASTCGNATHLASVNRVSARPFHRNTTKNAERKHRAIGRCKISHFEVAPIDFFVLAYATDAGARYSACRRSPMNAIPAPKQSGRCVKIGPLVVCPHLVYLTKTQKRAVHKMHLQNVSKAQKPKKSARSAHGRRTKT
jgi:hypothetical protein